MKRPFAVLGFSMLAASLMIYNMSLKATVAVIIAAAVAFCLLLLLPSARRGKTALFALFAVIVFSLSLLSAQYKYYRVSKEIEGESVKISGVVCKSPSLSDYAATYIIRVDEVDGKSANFKIRYVTEPGKQFKQGDIVNGNVLPTENGEDTDSLENGLSSNIYFTCFETKDDFLSYTGRTDKLYTYTGAVKNYFVNAVNLYIPGENGAIANAMAIGDKSGIDSYTFDCFNYAGTVHLLVISGLHLTVWSLGVIRALSRFSRLRKYTPFIGAVCVLAYSAVTGFSVSVLRAGAMVGAVLMGKVLKRDADSINSIGLAVTFILIFNPFSAYSASLWLTVLSTSGIIVGGNYLKNLIYNTRIGKRMSENALFIFFTESAAVSISAAVFTLPVMIVKFNLIPVMFILSNLLMVQPAMLLMFLAVIGMTVHALHIYPLAQGIYVLCGFLAKYLRTVAELIGMSRFSTISVSHRYYRYFLVLMLISAAVWVLCRKKKINLTKHICTFLAVTFALLSLYCTSYEALTPSLDFIGQSTVITANGECVVIGCPDKQHISEVYDVMERHNVKKADQIVLTEQTEYTPSLLINAEKSLRSKETVSCAKGYEAPLRVNGKISKIKVGDCVKVYLSNPSDCIEILCRNTEMLIVNCESAEKVFENGKKYDIIILYGENEDAVFEYASSFLKNGSSEIYRADKSGRVSVYFDLENL